MRRRIAANPKPPLTPEKRRKEKNKLKSMDRGYLKIDALWARIGVQVTP